MLISKLALLAALGLTAAAYPASRPDHSNSDTSNPTPGQYISPHLAPGTKLPPGGQLRRHEGHDPESSQDPPSGPSSKPDVAKPSYGEHPGSPERPDRNQFGGDNGEHHGHGHHGHHDKPGKDDMDRNGKDKDGKQDKDRSPGQPSKPDATPSASRPSITATSTRISSTESVASSAPTPTASLNPEMPAGPVY